MGNKSEERLCKSLLRELPYFNYRGNLSAYLGKFTAISHLKSKRNLEKLTSLYDLDLFSLNTNLDNSLSFNEYINRLTSGRYFSPHSFEHMLNRFKHGEISSGFSIFHNNVVSLRRNFESHLLDELDFHFNIIGVKETKITNSNQSTYHPHISGYIFEHARTPLASGGAGMFIDETLNYHVLERVSNEAFQAVWIQISFEKVKNIICGIIYRQRNSPDRFKQYFEESL